MPFVQFDLERWQSTWETRVRHNLSESGVHPLSIAELLQFAGGDISELAAMRMVYSQSDGTEELRSSIAELYNGATPEHVLVTIGSSEANFITCWTLIEPGDRVAILTPTYMQTWGLAMNFGADVATFALRADRGWDLDPREIEQAITRSTKLVVVTNPNNPTGHVLSPDARDAILECTSSAGAWLLADEVYQGAELNGKMTASFWGSYERVLAVNGLSKAYGLPGLRIGWIVGPTEFKESVVKRHDYTVIGPSPASDYLAIRALAARSAILARTRGILNDNYPILDEWLSSFGTLFDWSKPDCGAICFVRYRHNMSALALVERVRAEHSILLVPGEHFQLPYYLRLGYGSERAEFETALEVLREGITKLLMD